MGKKKVFSTTGAGVTENKERKKKEYQQISHSMAMLI